MSKQKQEPVQTVLGIPGTWKNRTEIVTSIAERSGGYLFAGVILMDTKSKDGFRLDVYDHDPQLKHAFEIAGGIRFTEEQLQAIEAHTFTLYIVGEGGSTEAAAKLMHAANATLKSGGLGVKVESAGTAQTPEAWARFAESAGPSSLLHAYVAFVGNELFHYSCGMHNLGLPDAKIIEKLGSQEAINVLRTFNEYLLVESPVMKNGHTFSVDEYAPKYRLQHQACDTYPEGDLFHNPFGMWVLMPVGHLGA